MSAAMSLGSLHVGLVGLGFGVRVHLPAFRAIPGVVVAAVCDSGSGRAQEVAREVGVPAPFNDWREMIASAIDVVSVATPPSSHREIATAALAAGKHVLCEKPLGRSLADALSMESAAAAQRGLTHAVCFQFRFEPGLQEIARLVVSGALGALRRIQACWLTEGRADPARPWSWQNDLEAGGGVLEGFGSHMLDYTAWIARRRWLRVQARSSILIPERRDSEGNKRQVTADDSFDLIGELEGGIAANLSASNCQTHGCGHRIEVFGDKGRAVFIHQPPFDQPARLEMETEASGPTTLPLPTGLNPQDADSRLGPFRELVRRFVAAVRGEPAPDLPDFSEGVRIRAALDAARESIKTGAEVGLSSPKSATPLPKQ
jgi:predicted dehydrogenase